MLSMYDNSALIKKFSNDTKSFLGSVHLERKKKACYRSPWKFTDGEIRRLCHLTKIQFLKLAKEQEGSLSTNNELNIQSETLLFLIRIMKDHSFEELSAEFALGTYSILHIT